MQIHKEKDHTRVIAQKKIQRKGSMSRLEDFESESVGENILRRCGPFSHFVKDSLPKMWNTRFGINCNASFFLHAVLS